MAVSPGRLAAARALVAVERGHHVEDALARHATDDRALAWHLALGVLRHRSELDAQLVAVAKRATRTIDPEVLQLLRIGVFEGHFSRTPPHAVVDQAVAATRALEVGHAAGFVNAVLRRAVTTPLPEGPGHPDWLAARWRHRYGLEAADAWMAANNTPALLYVVAKEDPTPDWNAAGVRYAFVRDGIYEVDGPVDQLPGFAEGRFWVMDPAAVAVADLVPDVPLVLDACAAPGGKSLRLAARGLGVVAVDREPLRLDRLRENVARVGLVVEALAHDWATGPLDRSFPAVLLDAPCTGLGTLRRHPDIRWRRDERDIQKAAAKQKLILRNAAACVEPGGCLVYAVCSPEPEEGPQVVATLGWPEEARFSNAPCVDGGDAFFAVRLRNPTR